MRKNSLAKAPFDHQGGLLEWVSPYGQRNVDWRDNEPFEATLRLTGHERGRSSARFMFEDVETGAKYPMFMVDLTEVLQVNGIGMGGVVRARWWVRKRGQNYGLALAT